MAILNRWQGVLIAFLMTGLLMGRMNALDGLSLHEGGFWLVWLLCMVLLALPLLLLESALAKRTQALPLIALPVLTRDADASPRWRIVGWLGLVGIFLLAGLMIQHFNVLAIMLLHPLCQSALSQAPSLLVVGGTLLANLVVVFALSFVATARLALVGVVLMLAMVGLELVNVPLDALHWSAISWQSAANAVVFALGSTGLGLGLYWAGFNQSTAETKPSVGYGVHKSKAESPRRAILPIWISQVLAGVLTALGFTATFPNYLDSVNQGASATSQHVSMIFSYTWALNAAALLCGAALLLGIVRVQLLARGMKPIVVAGILAVGLLLWMLNPFPLLSQMTIALVLLVAAIYAIFAGWQMKSSHLRKALNFNNEALYNLWRVQIRILVPLAVLLALVGLVYQCLQALAA